MKGLVLQKAYAQTIRDQHANKWVVYDANSEELGKLPACLNEQEAMDVLRFARMYETVAYSQGAIHGTERAQQAASAQIASLTAQYEALLRENERLSSILETKIIDEGN